MGSCGTGLVGGFNLGVCGWPGERSTASVTAFWKADSLAPNECLPLGEPVPSVLLPESTLLGAFMVGFTGVFSGPFGSVFSTLVFRGELLLDGKPTGFKADLNCGNTPPRFGTCGLLPLTEPVVESPLIGVGVEEVDDLVGIGVVGLGVKGCAVGLVVVDGTDSVGTVMVTFFLGEGNCLDSLLVVSLLAARLMLLTITFGTFSPEFTLGLLTAVDCLRGATFGLRGGCGGILAPKIVVFGLEGGVGSVLYAVVPDPEDGVVEPVFCVTTLLA